MFPNGVSAYVDLMQDLIPGMKDGTVRTAIDTGCGVSTTQLTTYMRLLFSFPYAYLTELHELLDMICSC